MVINIKWRYSNTTFVKVKLIKWNKIMRKLYNSNTTFVKVKFYKNYNIM